MKTSKRKIVLLAKPSSREFKIKKQQKKPFLPVAGVQVSQNDRFISVLYCLPVSEGIENTSQGFKDTFIA